MIEYAYTLESICNSTKLITIYKDGTITIEIIGG